MTLAHVFDLIAYFLVGAIILVIFVYIIIRLGTAAYYRSKHEAENGHKQKQKPRQMQANNNYEIGERN